MASGFLMGGVSACVATTVIQPIDLVKVRIQVGAAQGLATHPMEVARHVLKQDGFAGFYRGVTASYTRQFMYSGARLGLYDVFTNLAGEPGQRLPMWKTSLCSMCAGGMGAVVGNPADLSLVRMQSDTLLPVAERRNYRGVFHALSSIVRDEGAAGLFRGAVPTATRAMFLNLGMLGCNTKAKDLLADLGAEKGGRLQVFGASAIAGFFASLLSLPFDFVKTQMQRQKPDPVTGELPFRGPIDCLVKQVRQGGVTRPFTGFPTYYVRVAPHAMITLIVQDKLKRLYGGTGS